MERISSATPVLISLLFSDILMHIAENNECKATSTKVVPKFSQSSLKIVFKLC